MKPRLYMMALAVFWFLAPPRIRGEMVITISDTPPPETDLLLAQDTADYQDYSLRRGAGPEVGVGQTFHLPSDTTLAKITVRLGSQDELAGLPVALTIGRFSNPDDGSMNTLLSTHSGRLPDMNVEGPVYVTFDVEDLPLEGGQQYGFLLRLASGRGRSGPRKADVLHLGEDGYGAGRPFLLDGANYKPLYDDLVFFLHGETLNDGTSSP